MNLTLIIPTKNRHQILKSTLEFYIKNNFTFKILVLDSSDESELILNKNFINKKVNITHLNIKGWTTEVIKKSKKFVNTSYVTYTGDDDILCVNNVKYFLNFLKRNKNFSGVHGEAIVANFKKNQLQYTCKYLFNAIKKKKTIERLEEFFDNYTILMFAISRKKIFFKAINLVPNKNIRYKCPDKGICDEVIPCAGLSYFGRYENIHIPQLVRTVGHTRTDLKKIVDKKSINYLIQVFENLYYKDTKKNLNQRLKDKILQKYLNRKIINNKNIFKEILKSILSFFFLKKFIKKFYVKIMNDRYSKEYILETKNKNYKDFKLILDDLSFKKRINYE